MKNLFTLLFILSCLLFSSFCYAIIIRMDGVHYNTDEEGEYDALINTLRDRYVDAPSNPGTVSITMAVDDLTEPVGFTVSLFNLYLTHIIVHGTSFEIPNQAYNKETELKITVKLIEELLTKINNGSIRNPERDRAVVLRVFSFIIAEAVRFAPIQNSVNTLFNNGSTSSSYIRWYNYRFYTDNWADISELIYHESPDSVPHNSTIPIPFYVNIPRSSVGHLYYQRNPIVRNSHDEL